METATTTSFSFINTTKPGEATTGRAIGSIRSHVATQLHASRRQRKCAGIDKVPRREADDETRKQRHPRQTYPPKKAVQASSLLGASQKDPIGECAYIVRQGKFLQPSRVNSSQGFARPLDDDEHLLLDFYSSYVLYNTYRLCHHKGGVEPFAVVMRKNWLPFALSHPSLLSGIFHVASRTFVSTTDPSNARKFELRKFRYRANCLDMARVAIAQETLPSDTTISLALLLATESFFEGDIDSFIIHGTAVIRMVTARGGLHMLGLSGLLSQLIEQCICDPVNAIINGPIPPPGIEQAI